MLRRTRSEETLATLVNPTTTNTPPPHHDNLSPTSDQISLFTTQSEETLTNNPQIKIMNHPLSQFTTIREIPIISTFLHPGVSLYKSAESFERNELPILIRVPTKKLSLFRLGLGVPFLNIHRYNADKQRVEFCRAWFKIYSTNITYYILEFPGLKGGDGNGMKVYLINNNSHKPTVDFEYLDSQFRVLGVTGTTSTFGTNGLIRMYVMKSSENLLTHEVSIKPGSGSGGNNNNKLNIDNKLSRIINKQDRYAINEMIGNETPLIRLPLATYVDMGNVKIKKNFIKNGVIKLFDYDEHGARGGSDDNISEECLILCCVMLVLREQEYRKYKGDKKPQMV
ncbi:uncharacterized protein J8A68_000798 [[Candida] subhashii]|uniref:Uncharacterized protein n=1 Tax=[Candida] subhashii TaxID=561895 RepID=A0A8J5QM54_9ASCO|nr:uncharacterized protein J8A68_000798 [[Candida] subhashii]KAG7665592.1 hypothetical protein J8A68_000798 [[Candida] subhashii]